MDSRVINESLHEEPYIRLSKFAALCGSTVFTVRRWLKDNPDIPRRQTPSGVVVRFSEGMDWFDTLFLVTGKKSKWFVFRT